VVAITVIENTRIDLTNYYKISYSLVMILELNNSLEIQYKKIIIINNCQAQFTLEWKSTE